MSALTLVGLPLAALFLVLGIAKLLAVAPMRRAAAHAGVGVGAYRAIGVAELSAVAGLIAGHEWPALGLVTVVGVLALLLGTFVVHSRNRDPFIRWVPAVGSAGLAVAYAALIT